MFETLKEGFWVTMESSSLVVFEILDLTDLLISMNLELGLSLFLQLRVLKYRFWWVLLFLV